MVIGVNGVLVVCLVQLMVEQEEQELVLRAHYGELSPRIDEGDKMPAGVGLCGRALASAKTAIENDLKSVPDQLLLYAETASRMCIPLVSVGQTLGVLVLDSATSGSF